MYGRIFLAWTLQQVHVEFREVSMLCIFGSTRGWNEQKVWKGHGGRDINLDISCKNQYFNLTKVFELVKVMQGRISSS